MHQLTFRRKYHIALVVAIVGAALILSGAAELSSSFGVAQLIQEGATQLIVGLVVFVPSAPMAVYYRARNNEPLNRAKVEIDAILADKKDKEN